jgi:alpha-glucoside transport system substrate-binding protein
MQGHEAARVRIIVTTVLVIGGLLAAVPALAVGAGPDCSVGPSGYDFTTIQTAIDDTTCETITVAAGTYPEHLNVNSGNARDLTITGAGKGVTVVDGTNSGRVLTYSFAGGTTLEIENLSLVNGRDGAGSGGGIYVQAGDLVLNDVEVARSYGHGCGGGIFVYQGTLHSDYGLVVEENVAIFGGGVCSQESTVDLTGAVILLNVSWSGDGGGVNVIGPGGSFTVTDTEISGNIASWPSGGTDIARGGGVYNRGDGTFTSYAGLIAMNTAGDSGGGLFNEGAMTIDGTRVTGNTATWGNGGGIGNSYGTLNIVNGAVIDDNHAFFQGGGVSTGGTTIIADSFIQSNTAMFGGGVYCHETECTIRRSLVSRNNAYDGGGIYSDYNNLNVEDSTVEENIASYNGGGIHTEFGSTSISDSLILNNDALSIRGGGLYSNRTPTEILRSNLSGNTANQLGGGIYQYRAPLSIDSTLIAGNTAASGGGLYANHFNAAVTMLRSTVSGNSATSNVMDPTHGVVIGGGGIMLENSAGMNSTNSTISGNTAVGVGGGILFFRNFSRNLSLHHLTITENSAASGGGIYVDQYTGAVFVDNTILAGNTAPVGPDCTGEKTWDVLSNGYNLVGDTTDCGYYDDPHDLIGIDPLLGPLQDNGGLTPTHALSGGSPAIDAGFFFFATEDQRGEPRPSGPVPDIGAFELQNQPPVADADGPYLIAWGDDLVLDGSGSFDPNGDPLTYSWTLGVRIGPDDFGIPFLAIPPGPDPTVVVPWADLEPYLFFWDFDPDDQLGVELHVTDSAGAFDDDTTTFEVDIPGPVADADGPYVVEYGTGFVDLDASGSSDPKVVPFGPTDPTLLPLLSAEWQVNAGVVPASFTADPWSIDPVHLEWSDLVAMGIDTVDETYPVAFGLTDAYGQFDLDITELTVVDTTPPECWAELIPIQVTTTQGEFFVAFQCTDIADPEVEIVADVNGVPVHDGQNLDLVMYYDGQVVYPFLGGWIIKAPGFVLTVTGTDDSGNQTTMEIEPLFENTYPSIGPPNAEAPPPNQPYEMPPDPVRILGPFQGFEAEILQMELAATGVDFVYEVWEGEELLDIVNGPNPPDLIMVPEARTVLELRDALVDLGGFFDEAALRAAYSDYLIDLVSADGAILAGPISAALKSLVWYKPDTFAVNGYAIPETFTELIALSDQMVADGQTPWCQYMESGFATGWYGTDWVEDILLGTDGPAVYDQWVAHDVLFSDPRVEDAFERYLQILDTPGYTFDRGNVTNVFFFANALPLGSGDCLMHKQGTFFRFAIEESGFDLADFATFHFPAVNPAYADRAMGGGSFVAAISDRPEVVQMLTYILSPDFGTDTLADVGWIMPHSGFDTGHYSDPLVQQWGEIVQDAILAGQFRFDASDLMPPDVGSGTFWTGITELVDGLKTIPQVLADIDASWPLTLTLLALPEPVECTVELTKLYGYWNQGTFRVSYSCDGPVETMTADLNGHEVNDGDMVELVKTWGSERAYDMFGMWRIEAPEFLLTLTTTGPDSTWTALPDF